MATSWITGKQYNLKLDQEPLNRLQIEAIRRRMEIERTIRWLSLLALIIGAITLIRWVDNDLIKGLLTLVFIVCLFAYPYVIDNNIQKLKCVSLIEYEDVLFFRPSDLNSVTVNDKELVDILSSVPNNTSYVREVMDQGRPFIFAEIWALRRSCAKKKASVAQKRYKQQLNQLLGDSESGAS